MAKYNSLNSLFTSIANAIRTKAKTTEDIAADDFPEKILDIASGTDVSDTTATASDVLDSKYFYTSSGIRTKGGIVPKTDSGNVTLTPTTSEVSKSYPSGYYPNAHGAKVSAVSGLSPSAMGEAISNGKIYKALKDGYAINSLFNVRPSDEGLWLKSGENYHMNGEGYVYSTPPIHYVKDTSWGSGARKLPIPNDATTVMCVTYSSTSTAHIYYMADRTRMKYSKGTSGSASGSNDKSMNSTTATSSAELSWNADNGWYIYSGNYSIIEIYYN